MNHKKPRRKLFSYSLGSLIGGLAAFHAWILWERIWDLSVLQTGVVVQWSLAAILLAVAFYLRSKGVNLLRGKPAAAYWLMVLLLHFAGTVPLPDSVAVSLEHAAAASVQLVVPVGIATTLTLLMAGLYGLAQMLETSFQARHQRFATLAIKIPRTSRHGVSRFSRPPPFFIPHS